LARLPVITGFVAALQEVERTANPNLLPGADICTSFTDNLVRMTLHDGIALVVRTHPGSGRLREHHASSKSLHSVFTS
jgi:hypothetical protein